jgi:hypothetical protein
MFLAVLPTVGRVCVIVYFSEKMLCDTEIIFWSLSRFQIQLTSHSFLNPSCILIIYTSSLYKRHLLICTCVVITSYHVFLTSSSLLAELAPDSRPRQATLLTEVPLLPAVWPLAWPHREFGLPAEVAPDSTALQHEPQKCHGRGGRS